MSTSFIHSFIMKIYIAPLQGTQKHSGFLPGWFDSIQSIREVLLLTN